jgi:formylglycine-generating enzyme required for sulfatase activity
VVVGGVGLAVVAGVVALGYVASIYLLPVSSPATPTQGPATATLAVVGPTGNAPTPLPATTAAPSPTEVLPSDTPAVTDTPASTATPEAGAIQISETDAMVQVYVPAGTFTMGNNLGPADQQPEHQVYLDSFWIDQTEVTNAMYAQCVSTGQCAPPLETHSFTRADYCANPEFANYPVLFVNWNQARAYCEWAGRRLPSEAEWERAARGSDVRPYPWGNEAPDPSRLNFGLSGFGDTVAAGQYPAGASPYGALDLAGNAWEWVADWYDPGYYAVSPGENPSGPETTGCPEGDCKVLRGGSWDSTDAQVAATTRLFFGPNDSRDAFTIRCAQSP